MTAAPQWCHTCKEYRSVDAFRRGRSSCRVCDAAKTRAWREKHPEKVEAWNLSIPRKWKGEKWARLPADVPSTARYHYRRTGCARKSLRALLPSAMASMPGGFVVGAWRDGETNRAGVYGPGVLPAGVSVIARCRLLAGCWIVLEPVVRPSLGAVWGDYDALHGMVVRLVARLFKAECDAQFLERIGRGE